MAKKATARKTARSTTPSATQDESSVGSAPDPALASAAIRRSLGIPLLTWQQRMRQAERLKEKEDIASLRDELFSLVETVDGRLQAKREASRKYHELVKAIGKAVSSK